MNKKNTRHNLIAYWKMPFILLFATLFVVNTGCNKDDDPVEPIDPIEEFESVSKQISSSDAITTLTLEGVSMIVPALSIPNLLNGDPANVSFTLEVGGELPQTLPTEMTIVNESIHFGPEGFIFQEPIWLTFELPNQMAFDEVSIVGFLSETQEYGIIPISYYDEDNRVVGISVYELGHYFMVNAEGLNRRTNGTNGGFHLTTNNTNNWYPRIAEVTGLPSWASADTYYKIIITDFVAADPSSLAYWAEYNPNTNGGRKYWEFATPPVTTGWKPNHRIGIVSSLPQGEYTAQLIASHKTFQSDNPECRQYSIPLTFVINGGVECPQVGSCTGWSHGPDFPANGTWEPMDCREYKPLATIPVCTGDFQATLTWNNGPNGDTDLDLYLNGPDNLSVNYTNKNPGVGGIILDRDVISDPGLVQENICAPTLSGMPSGEYKVLVDHYDGEPKNFQVRILIGSDSRSYSGSLVPDAEQALIRVFTLD